MKGGIFAGVCMYILAQTLAWFQSNSLIISEWTAKNYIALVLILSPFAGLAFTLGTKYLYSSLEQLWAVRFIGFASGYMIFIPLTWWFFGESPFTMKNLASIILCTALIAIQILWK